MCFLYIILSTTFFYLNDVILFYKVSFFCVYISINFASTLCMLCFNVIDGNGFLMTDGLNEVLI